ncbi:MAG: hypothetical protein K2M97_02895 [Muribaculaceae bacterium]|nr:hypothetical protein [Muribaculaceae bacterium]
MNVSRRARLLSAAIIAAICMTVTAKADDESAQYRQFSEEIKAEVYGMDLPAFKVTEIPEKYRNESAVVIAVYHGIDAKKKTGFGRKPGELLVFTRKARVEGGILERMLIRINDKAALEKYSEFDFATKLRKKHYDGYEKHRQVMGVRVRKPDGRIIDVNTDDYVEVEEGKNGREKRRKLAIPGLEVGDDIDVFFYTESKLQNRHLDPMEFYLKDDYPILNYTIHGVIDDNLTTQYRTINGAPDFKVSRDADKNFVLDMEVTDIGGKEPRIWYNPVQQSPMVKMSIFNRRSEQYTPPSARKDGLQGNPDVKTIKDDRWDSQFLYLQPKIGEMFITDNNIADGKAIVKRLDALLKLGQYSTTDVSDYIYNLYAYVCLINDLDPSKYGLQPMWQYMNRRKAAPERGLTSDSRNQPIDSILDSDDAIWYLHPAVTDRYYVPWEGVFAPSEVPPLVQGRKAQAWRPAKERKKHPETEADIFLLPESSADDNVSTSTVNAAINGSDLRITRTESATGTTKYNAQKILTYENLIKGYEEYLNRDGITVKPKANKKRDAEREERFADNRSKQTDKFKEEISSYHHGEMPTDFEGGKVTAIGIDPANPALEYELTYTMNGLVKQAGKNLVLSVGRLISDQLELLESDRTRSDDVHMISARTYSTIINVELPAGFHISDASLTALARNVSNPAGSFRVSATQTDGKLRVEVTKIFNRRIIPAAEWPELVSIVDAAKSWESSTVLLEK